MAAKYTKFNPVTTLRRQLLVFAALFLAGLILTAADDSASAMDVIAHMCMFFGFLGGVTTTALIVNRVVTFNDAGISFGRFTTGAEIEPRNLRKVDYKVVDAGIHSLLINWFALTDTSGGRIMIPATGYGRRHEQFETMFLAWLRMAPQAEITSAADRRLKSWGPAVTTT